MVPRRSFSCRYASLLPSSRCCRSLYFCCSLRSMPVCLKSLNRKSPRKRHFAHNYITFLTPHCMHAHLPHSSLDHMHPAAFRIPIQDAKRNIIRIILRTLPPNHYSCANTYSNICTCWLLEIRPLNARIYIALTLMWQMYVFFILICRGFLFASSSINSLLQNLRLASISR